MRFLQGALVLAIFAFSLNAFARAFDEGSDVGVPPVQYLSWCVGNTLTQPDTNGQPVAVFNCEERGARCVQQERFAGHLRIIHALCR